VIHDFIACLDVKPDTAFVDANDWQDFSLYPFKHGFRVRGIAHGDLLCAYEGGVHKVLFFRLLGHSRRDTILAILLMHRPRISPEL